ncbi:MAG: glycosyltransferase, partial [Promethearchaeota archaeon]
MFVISSLGYGGAERVVINLINHLDRNKFESLLVIFNNKLDLKSNLNVHIKIVCLGKKERWHFLRIILKLRKVINNYKPDSVISFLQYTNIVTILSTLFQKRNYTLIISERNYNRKYLANTRLRFLKKWLMDFTYKKADTIIAVSKAIKRVLQEDFRIPPGKIKIIYNPVNLKDIISKSQKSIIHIFFKNNYKIIIGVGRLVEQKRFDRLLKTFCLVRKNLRTARLIILGDGKLRKKLERLAFQLNIENFVDFVGYKNNPYAWMSKAHIFVLCSDYEGFPNVLIEAMACGLPVISTNCISGPSEIITNGSDGILVKPSDKKKLAEEILNLLNNEKKRKDLSEAAKERVKDFEVEKIVYQYLKLI